MALPPPTCVEMGAFYRILGWFELSAAVGYTTPSSTNPWSTAAPMDVGHEAVAATTGLDGKIYVLGGLRDGLAQSVVEVFEPSLGQWTSIAPMPTPRWGLAAVTGPDGRIYALGGINENGTLATVEVYDPSAQQWSSVARLISETSFLAAATGSDGR